MEATYICRFSAAEPWARMVLLRLKSVVARFVPPGNGNGGSTDNILPVFTNCPDDLVSYVNGPDATSSVAWTVPTATDNSGIPPTVTGGLSPPVSLGVGSTTVTYTATDASGNQVDCTFTVSIIRKIIGLF